MMGSWFCRPRPRKNANTFRPAIELLEGRVVPSTYYVATTGSNSNNGSAKSPFATVQQAANTVQAGDTVIIEAGTYAGFDVQTTGIASDPITFEAAPGAQVVINSPETNRGDSGINIEDFENGSSVNYITIEGLNINNAHGDITIGIRAVWNGQINSTGIQLIDNTITNCGAFGILTSHEDHLLIEANSVSGTTGTGLNGHGIYVGNACFDPSVIGNTIFDNESLGLHMNGDASEGAAIESDGTDDGNAGNIVGAVVEDNVIYDNGLNGINCDGVQNSIFENNLLYDNGGGIVLYVVDAAAAAINNVIVNNTITVLSTDTFGNAGRWDIQIMDGAPEDGALPDVGSTGNTVFDNILINQNSFHGSIEIGPLSLSGFSSNYNVITTSGDTGSTSSHAFDLVDSSGDDNFVSLATWRSDTGQDGNSITADSVQLFVAPSWTVAGGNYQLLSTSPAINAGVGSLRGIAVPTTDIVGNPRPGGTGYDIGAYQPSVVPGSFSGPASSLPNPPWDTVLGGGFSINGSNQAVSAPIVQGLFKAATVESLSLTNVSVSADVTLNPAPANGLSAAAVIARSQDANDVNNCYFAALTPAPGGLDQLLIEKVINGQIFGVAAKALPAGTTSGNLMLEVFGNTLTAYFNGQLEVTTTDSTYTTGGNVGIGAEDQGASVANFVAHYLATPPLPFSDEFTRSAANTPGGPWYVNAALPVNSTTGPGGGFGINGSKQAVSLGAGLNVATLFGANLTTSSSASATVVNAAGGAGVVVAWNSATQSGYGLFLSGSSLQMYLVVNSNVTKLGTAQTVSGSSGTVGLLVSGGILSAFFNGKFAFSLNDTTFTSGSAGLAASGAGATFSNFNLSGS